MTKFMWNCLENSEVLKNSIDWILPEVDRSNKSQSIEISQNLLLQKRARTPNQEFLHDKKQFSLWFSQQNMLVAWPWLSLAREETLEGVRVVILHGFLALISFYINLLVERVQRTVARFNFVHFVVYSNSFCS